MSRGNAQVRPATHDDVAGVVGFVRAIEASTSRGRSAAGGSGAGRDVDALTRRFSEILSGDERTVLIALDEPGTVVGMLIARRDDVGAVDLTPVLHLTHLIVATDQRRRGVGRALLGAATALADDAGVDHLLATVANGSREGNRYLARLGFGPLEMQRMASVAGLRRTLGLGDISSRTAVLRRARMARSQRSAFGARAVHRGA